MQTRVHSRRQGYIRADIGTLVQTLVHSCRQGYTRADIGTLVQTRVHSCRHWYTRADKGTLVQTRVHSCRQWYTRAHKGTLVQARVRIDAPAPTASRHELLLQLSCLCSHRGQGWGTVLEVGQILQKFSSSGPKVIKESFPDSQVSYRNMFTTAR